MAKIKHGFQGQKMIILPLHYISQMENNTLMNDLFIHSLGYFPQAYFHYISRPNGCIEHILIYCVKGEGWFCIDNNTVSLVSNQFVILEQNTPHKYGASNHDPWSIYWFHFKGYKSDLFSSYFNKVITIENKRNGTIFIDIFNEIYDTLDYSFDLQALLYTNLSFGYLVGTVLLNNFKPKNVKNKRYGTSIVNLATHYMNDNIDKKLKLEEIASHFDLSVSYFYRLFNDSMKVAPMEYFNQLKIHKACSLLENTSRNIHDISYSLGIDDPYYFSRLFKKIVGIPPIQYRLKTQTNHSL